ncbi:hypothetical protein BKA70DRAFT_1269714 [Coprinopsis sp. MPI-PUGE-AT-0042]|nr:hypothetical protein BKA70DRAFT_1269714 [Coprinopsis sp. MPI-PUGE-AT-0042]
MGKTFQFVHPTNSNKLSPRFVPHGLLPIPSLTLPGLPPVADHTRVYRLVYPCLLAASSTKAYVWDVRTMKRVQTIDDIMNVNASGAGKNIPEGSYKGVGQGEEELPISPVIPNSKRLVSEEHPMADFPVHQPFALGLFDQCSPFAARLQPRASPHAELGSPDPLSLSTDAPGPLGLIRYVELSEKWVFVVRDEYFTLYKRNSDSGEPFTITPGQLALRLPGNRERYGKWKARLGSKSVREHPDSELVKQEVIWDSQAVENNKKKLWDHLIAAHVSPDQQHLVLLTGSSRLIFIPSFERVIYRQAKLYDIAIDIQLGSSTSTSVYLAYGSKSNPRISVVTDIGVFLITPYFNSSPDREVDLTIHRVAPFFLDPDRLELVTCLMMSDTGLWLTWARGEGMDDTPEAERAVYAPLLQSRWASELRKQMREEDRMLSTRSVEEGQRNDVWQKRTNGKYAWKLRTDDAKKRAWSLFEWKFVRGLKTAPKIQTRMNGDRQVVMPGDSYEGEDVLWFQCAEVHQVKFT